jgi:hypothetical protein
MLGPQAQSTCPVLSNRYPESTALLDLPTLAFLSLPVPPLEVIAVSHKGKENESMFLVKDYVRPFF